ncbi:fructose-bisphosphate aldolase [Rossellomorea vietnamensis]|uniref:fructose-bisphosphate aldolase n=1 Tax=Rossellomorea vietnamensis TaxID=218284 RepID=UPI001E4CB158|nr:fructose-bisphosphate aldolase [Rossellomorea vietnamensis]MCC5804318.1 fructose-bisphosphate aldolase [Rossellomorea vietnamensis]
MHISRGAVISYINDEEYKELSTEGLDHPSKNDFRKFTFTLNIEHSEDVIKRDITFPDDQVWKKTIDTIDGQKRYWVGKGNEQNNEDENVVTYYREFIFYSKGLTNKDIKKALNTIEFEVYIETEVGTPTEETYRVGDYIEVPSQSGH